MKLNLEVQGVEFIKNLDKVGKALVEAYQVAIRKEAMRIEGKMFEQLKRQHGAYILAGGENAEIMAAMIDSIDHKKRSGGKE